MLSRACVPLVTIVLLAGCGGSSGNTSEELRARVQQDILKEGGAQLKAGNPATSRSPTAVDTVEGVECTETATNRYACLTHYSVSDPAKGVNHHRSSVEITAACSGNADCKFAFGNASSGEPVP